MGRSGIGLVDEAVIAASTQALNSSNEILYTCQATSVKQFTEYWPWWDFRQYIEDLQSKNVTFEPLLWGAVFQTYMHITQSWRNHMEKPSHRI